MPQSIIFRQTGPTTALTVSTVTGSSVTISPSVPDQCDYAAFLNVGTVPVAIQLSPNAPTPLATFPTNGAVPPNTWVLPAAMNWHEIIAVPKGINNSFAMSAVCNSSVAPTIFVTPVGAL